MPACIRGSSLEMVVPRSELTTPWMVSSADALLCCSDLRLDLTGGACSGAIAWCGG